MTIAQSIMASTASSEIITPSLIVDGILMNLDAATYNYETGIWTDSVNARQFTMYNSPNWSSTNGGQLTFTSSSQQYGYSPTNFSAQPYFTLHSVFKINELPAAVSIQDGNPELPAIFTEVFDGYSNPSINFVLGFVANNTTIGGGYYYNLYNWHQATTTAATNSWYDMAVTYDGTNLNLYVNGILVAYTPSSYTPTTYGSSGYYINRRWDAEQFGNTTIKTINLYNRALTPREIRKNLRYYASIVTV